MLKELRQKFLKAISIPIQIIPSTGSLDGYAIETKRLSSVIVSGTADENIASKLHDAGVFTKAAKYYVGMMAYNKTDHVFAKIISKEKDSIEFTVTIATPGVFTKTAHGLVEGNIIRLVTTDALPTGLVVDTDYYIIAAGLTANEFQVSATLGGSAVNTSGSQSGTHTYVNDDSQLALDWDAFPDGDEEFELYTVSEEFSFDSALALIEIGNITGTPTSVKVKVEEDDDSAFGGAAVAEGGTEITVAQDHSYTMEIKRTKRYLRIVVTTAGGSTPTVECFGAFILWNAAKPFPRLSADDIDNS